MPLSEILALLQAARTTLKFANEQIALAKQQGSLTPEELASVDAQREASQREWDELVASLKSGA